MAGIKVLDIAFGRLSAPDLDVAEEFLTEFGLARAERTADKLFMRGTDPDHHIHVTEKGDSGFISLAFNAASEEDLHKLAAEAESATGVEDIDEPGGGKRVTITEPNGYGIEVVWGIDEHAPLEVDRHPYNLSNIDKYARRELWRKPQGPSHVKRIGHGVIGTPKLRGSIAWIRHHIGIIGSDEVFVEDDEDKVVASFNRIDAGQEYVDHHVFLFIQNERAGLNHVSFEVPDFDDVVMGHEYLVSKDKYEHVWGLGRHVLGSQIYDYWKDPWDRVHEHWCDTDVLNTDYGTKLVSAELGFGSQWGEPPPGEFIRHVTP